MKTLCSLAVVLALSVLGSAGGHQQPPDSGQESKDNQAPPVQEKQRPQGEKASTKEKEDVVRISVTLVQIDAVVTDAKGRYVTDLRPQDFEILEDGRRQHITNFSYVNTQPAQVVSAPSTRPGTPTPAVPRVRLRPDQVRRTIALVVDDLGMSFESVQFVRESLKKFVDEQMQAGDLVAIVRTGAGMGALQQFTSDKRLLYSAIDRVRFNLMMGGGLGAFAPIGGGAPSDGGLGEVEFKRMIAETANARTELFAVGTLGALDYIVRGLKDLPGRKSVILLSDGFQLLTQSGGPRVLESVRRVVDLANRASVIVYTIDPRGLQTVGLTAADNTAFLSTREVRQQESGRSDRFYNSQGGLSYLAYQTGGFFVRKTNDISDGINRVLDDQKGYYLLGYIPEQTTFKLEQGKRKFHKLSVNVKRAGLRVRSRTGFYGVADEDTRPAGTTAQQQIVTALTSPFASGDIHLKLTSLFGHEETAGAFMRSILHIDARDLSFSEEQEGWRKGELNIVAVTFGDNGQIIDREGRTYNLSVRTENLQKLMDGGFIYAVNVPIKKPGGYQLRVAVRDARSERVGSANQFIDVPDIGRNRLTLSGLVVSGYDPARAKPASGAGQRGQVSDKEGAAEDNDPMISPAVRMLRRGTDLDYGYLIYNAQVDPKTKQPQIETQVLLLKDGKPVFKGKVNPLDVSEQPDLKHIPATGRLRLSADLVPGEYVVQVIVTDKLAKEKYRQAAQWMDFEVVK
ncbi:MAG: VWA domain-containing protein [Blastocatellia bacterium]